MPSSLDGDVADFVLAAPEGASLMVEGTEAAFRAAIGRAAPRADGRMALICPPIPPRSSAEQIAEAVMAAMAAAARASYPVWFRSACLKRIGDGRDGALFDAALDEIGADLPALSRTWARKAVGRALAGLAPRVAGVARAIELRQLALALNAGALTVVVPVAPPMDASAIVHALEWMAGAGRLAATALWPPDEPVPDLLRRLPATRLGAEPPPVAPDRGPAEDAPWIGPIEGRPHPNSEAEKRLAEALAADPGLAPVFACNQGVTTARGFRYRVDLLARAQRLVVEIDGFDDHGTRAAFAADRQRDYELLVTGYRVLRLTRDEVLRDMALTLEKLRDAIMVRPYNDRTDG